MPFNSFWGMNMNTSGNGIARTHETDALDLSTMTKHEMPYGIDAIAEIRMSTPAASRHFAAFASTTASHTSIQSSSTNRCAAMVWAQRS